MEKKVWEISWTSLWRILFMLVLVVTLYFLREVLIILFLAIVISSAIDAPITFLERKKFPRILGVLIIFIISLAIMSLLLYTIVPIAATESINLLSGLSKVELPVFGSLNIRQLTAGIETNISDLNNLTDVLFSGSASFIGITSIIFGGLFFVIAVLVLSFYLAVNQDGVERFLRAVLPLTHEDYIIDVYLRVRRKMGLWLRVQLVLSSAVGVATFLGLWILGVNYSLILGILAAIFEMVPFVGPIFTGALAFLIAIPESFILGVYVVILFIAIQQLESSLLIPAVMKKTIGLHPVVAVISLLAGAQLAGLPGIILSIPTAVILQEIIEDRATRKEKSRLI